MSFFFGYSNTVKSHNIYQIIVIISCLCKEYLRDISILYITKVSRVLNSLFRTTCCKCRLWSQTTWAQVLALPATSYVPVNTRYLTLYVSISSFLNRYRNYLSYRVMKINCDKHVKPIKQSFRH